jgi:hypothetical protein
VLHGVVIEEARTVADELGLLPSWINEQASVYVSGKDAGRADLHGLRRDVTHAPVVRRIGGTGWGVRVTSLGKRRVFDHRGLRVMVASPDHIFATNALAEHTRDIDDLRSLVALAEWTRSMTRGSAVTFPDRPYCCETWAYSRDVRMGQIRAGSPGCIMSIYPEGYRPRPLLSDTQES